MTFTYIRVPAFDSMTSDQRAVALRLCFDHLTAEGLPYTPRNCTELWSRVFWIRTDERKAALSVPLRGLWELCNGHRNLERICREAGLNTGGDDD